jgi:hypothetical protein
MQATKKRPTKKGHAPKPDDPTQYERFLEAARKAQAAQTEKEADHAFQKVARPPKPTAGK